MKVANRRQKILELIQDGTSNVEALCRLLSVSEATVRRDLSALAKQGSILRTYGGAADRTTHLPEASIEQRRQLFRLQKQQIANVALTLIEDHDTIILDSGTTTCALAQLLSQRTGLHVLTNNLLALPYLSTLPDGKVTILGGELRATSMSTFGPAAQAALSRTSADKVFLSGDGVTADRGLCEANAEQAFLKECMIASALNTYVLADSSKLGQAVQPCWTPLDSSWTLITDADDNAQSLAPFKSAGHISLLLVKPEQS